MADPEIFISGGPLTDLRGGPLQSRFSDSLYKQPNFFPKKGGPGPLPPPKSASGHWQVLYIRVQFFVPSNYDDFIVHNHFLHFAWKNVILAKANYFVVFTTDGGRFVPRVSPAQ